jgi:hypothetical protein
MKPQLELAKQSKQDDVLDATADEGAQEGKESAHDARVRAHKHESFLRQQLDTFIAYKWMLQALLRRWGDPATIAASLSAESEPARALARAIRVAHAIYKPDHVRLLGGVGLALARLGGGWRDLVARDLTCVARPNWSLGYARHEHHAAAGAARLSGGVVPSVPGRPSD